MNADECESFGISFKFCHNRKQLVSQWFSTRRTQEIITQVDRVSVRIIFIYLVNMTSAYQRTKKDSNTPTNKKHQLGFKIEYGEIQMSKHSNLNELIFFHVFQ